MLTGRNAASKTCVWPPRPTTSIVIVQHRRILRLDPLVKTAKRQGVTTVCHSKSSANLLDGNVASLARSRGKQYRAVRMVVVPLAKETWLVPRALAGRGKLRVGYRVAIGKSVDLVLRNFPDHAADISIAAVHNLRRGLVSGILCAVHTTGFSRCDCAAAIQFDLVGQVVVDTANITGEVIGDASVEAKSTSVDTVTAGDIIGCRVTLEKGQQRRALANACRIHRLHLGRSQLADAVGSGVLAAAF